MAGATTQVKILVPGDQSMVALLGQRDVFLKLIESGDLSAGMQKRIERSMAGEQLPGYYPLGEAPSKIW